MKKLLFVLLAITFLFACSKKDEQKVENTDQQIATTEDAPPPPPPSHRYGIKSGVVFYNAPMGAKQELYFDNYGAEEVFITSMDLGIAKTKSTEIRKEGYTYKFDEGKTEGTKTKWYTNDFNYSKPDPELMARYKVKELGTETIDGKVCQKYSAEFGGSPIVTSVWNNIMVRSNTKFGGKDLIIEATKIQETSVDPKMFELPAGVTFKEM